MPYIVGPWRGPCWENSCGSGKDDASEGLEVGVCVVEDGLEETVDVEEE